MIVRWSQVAAKQLFAAGDFLKRRRPSAEERLYAATQQVTEVIAQQPRAYAQVDEVRDGEVRRALVRPYGYWVIYEVHEARGECVVLSFWSTRRDPQGWRRER